MRRGSDTIFEVVDREGREVVFATRDRREAEVEANHRRHEAIINGDPGSWTPWASDEDLADLSAVLDRLNGRGSYRRLATAAGLDRKTVRAAELSARGETKHRPRRETVEALLEAIRRLNV